MSGGDETPFFPAPPTHVEAPQTTPGSQIDRYVVVETVGEGGMGTVLRAYDPRLRREVAIKRIRPDLLGAQTEARLEREAQAMARLTHRNVVAVYDVHAGDHGLFITMEFVPGTTMSRWWVDEDPSMELRLDALRRAGEGLRAAHQAGLVHRDFKPNNVIVARIDGTLVVKVTDFGLARSFEEPPRRDTATEDAAVPSESPEELEPLTQAGILLGTPGFMAPEQHDGQPADHRSDQYAFCVTAWQALTGKRPDQSPSPERVDALPRSIRGALERGLSPDPADRFASMDDLLRALRNRRSPWRRWVAAGAVAAVAGGLWTGAEITDRRARGRCATEAGAAQDVWSEARREQLGAGQHDDAADRVVSAFDDYAQRWATHRENVCVATDVEQTVAPSNGLDIRRCLDDRLRDLDVMIDVLSSGGAETKQRAVGAAGSLPPLDACLNPGAQRGRPRPPSDPETAELWETIFDRLRRARALTAVARYDEALELSKDALETARAVGARDALARALMVHGGLLGKTGDDARSEAELEEAYLELTRLGNDTEAAEAARALFHVVGSAPSRHVEAELWQDLAAVALDRAEAAGAADPDAAASGAAPRP